jgi:hypothetical protein
MEFNVTLSLVGLNMSALQHGGGGDGGGGDGENDGMALASTISNITHLANNWFDILGEPQPDPTHPGVVLLRIRFRVPRFGEESQESMLQRFNGYFNALHDIPRFNRELDVFATSYSAKLVGMVDISEVFVSGVAFVGNFMQNSHPTYSPAMGPFKPPVPGKLSIFDFTLFFFSFLLVFLLLLLLLLLLLFLLRSIHGIQYDVISGWFKYLSN